MAAKNPVPKLGYLKLFFECQGQGTSEGLDLPEPTTSVVDPLITLAGYGQRIATQRATMLPKECYLIDAIVGFYGKPADSLSCINDYLIGLKSGTTYKYGLLDNKNTCASFRLAAEGGSASMYWLRFIDDADALNSIFQSRPNGIVMPVPPAPAVAPAFSTYADNKPDIITRYLEFLMYYGVLGAKNPAAQVTTPPPGTLPYIASNYRWTTFGELGHRKLGAVRGAEKGRKKAFAS